MGVEVGVVGLVGGCGVGGLVVVGVGVKGGDGVVVRGGVWVGGCG